jgi:translation initiation factor 1
MTRQRNRNVVYVADEDTAVNKRCPRCGNYPCRCPKPKSLPPAEQVAHLHREKKGRGGKTVVVIRNLQLTPEDSKALATQLKKACGVGGAVKDDGIEIQGDLRDKVAAELQRVGYKTKNVGG